MDAAGNQAREAALAARDRKVAGVCGTVTAVLVVVTLAYASTRYVYFGPWEVGDIPIYVLNKSFAWSSLTLLGLAFLIGPLARLRPAPFAGLRWQRKYYGLAAFALASAHVMLSLMIFNYGYYKLFFEQVFQLTDLATATMSAGALAWLALTLPAALSFPAVQRDLSRRWWLRAQKAGLIALALGGVHVLYGAPGWQMPEAWHGGMPPITLINALTVLAVLVVRVVARVAGRDPGPAGDTR